MNGLAAIVVIGLGIAFYIIISREGIQWIKNRRTLKFRGRK